MKGGEDFPTGIRYSITLTLYFFSVTNIYYSCVDLYTINVALKVFPSPTTIFLSVVSHHNLSTFLLQGMRHQSTAGRLTIGNGSSYPYGVQLHTHTSSEGEKRSNSLSLADCSGRPHKCPLGSALIT